MRYTIISMMLLCPIVAAAADWPWRRGPAQDGRSDETVPTQWGPDRNIVWKTPVPGRGHASPAIRGERVFLATADEKAGTQSLLAFDRKTGKPLWTTVVHTGGLTRRHPKNSHASATPACDGQRVFIALINGNALHVTATDFDGKILWQKQVGSFKAEHGYGSSPVLYGKLVIVNGDSLQGSFLAALDRTTGETVWKIERPNLGRHGSYATPLVTKIAGKDQLILHGMRETASYDPASGQQLWRCDGPAEVTACTPVTDGEWVFSSGGFPEKELLAIRGDGQGDVTGSHVAWRSKSGVTYVPSPLYDAGRLYVVNDQGIATCWDARSGKQIWQERLGGAFSSSPVLAGGRIYVANEAGKLFVLKAGPTFGILATNDLGDGGFATPAIADGRIYLRTNTHLYCIGE